MNIVDKISQYRVNLMAIAIILVVVYHYKCWIGGFPWYIGMILKYGFIGVDMFFFLSGLGLTYSFRKNTLKNFWLNRCRNIIPVYLLYGAILVLVIYAEEKSLSPLEILYKYSTLEYTFEHKGVDWYMSAILQLYLLFPVLYHIVRFVKKGIILMVPVVFAISCFCDLHWSHLAMLQRIPMFLLGIYCAQNISNNANVIRMFVSYLILFLLLVPFSVTCDIDFLLADMITPVILFLSIALFDRICEGGELLYA